MKPVLIFRHDEWVGPGYFTDTLDRHDIPYVLIAIDRGDAIPDDVQGASALAFLGGDMSVNDSFSWIDQELHLIRLASSKKLPVFGHCFGAQLISKALGGVISTMPAKEIGWYKINFLHNEIAKEWFVDLPQTVHAIFWHGDAMTIPQRATPLYSTAFNAHQAFTIDNMIATIAHVEVTPAMLLKWLDEYYDEVTAPSDSVQSVEQLSQNLNERVKNMRLLTDVLYRRWLDRLYSYNLNSSNPD